MHAPELAEIFETLDGGFEPLLSRLKKFDLGQPNGRIDESFSDAIESLRRVIEATRIKLPSESERGLHWRTRRLLHYVQLDLYDLGERLSSLQIAVASFQASTPDEWSTRLQAVGIRSAIDAAVTFGVRDLLRQRSRFAALRRYYGEDGASSEAMRGEVPEVERMLEDWPEVESEEVLQLARYHGAPPPQQSVGDEREPTLCRLVTVMFATDRPPVTESDRLHLQFMNRRGTDSVTYGTAEVSIPRGHRRGRLERPSLWKLQLSEDPEKHVVVRTCVEHDRAMWQLVAEERLKECGTSSALVFIHGFNVGFDEAIRHAGQIGWDLQFDGLVTAFSWGSCAEPLDYLADETSARLSASRLANFLHVLRHDVGVAQVNIIAHSMGNLVLLEALKQFPTSQGEIVLEQVVLAAPDVDADEFKAAQRFLSGKARQYTLYGSETDRALLLSKKIRKDYPRAGDGGPNIVVVGGVDTVDASSVGGDLLGLGHSYFSLRRSLLSDIYYIIRESLPPSRRDGLNEVELGGLKYWIFVP